MNSRSHPNGAQSDAIALMYHDVCDHLPSGFELPGSDSYKIAVDKFEEHLNELTANHDPARGHDLSQAGVRLTFDDGGVSAHRLAADILEKRGWYGFFFVTTSQIGSEGFLSADAIRDLDQRGHIIGSHSHSHPLQMARLSTEQIANEWTQSCERLADITGRPVTVASIPGGMYSIEVVRQASAAGIIELFTSEPRSGSWQVDDCRVHGRFAIRHDTSTQWVTRVTGGSRWPRWQQRVAWESRKLAKKALGPVFLQIRNRLS